MVITRYQKVLQTTKDSPKLKEKEATCVCNSFGFKLLMYNGVLPNTTSIDANFIGVDDDGKNPFCLSTMVERVEKGGKGTVRLYDPL